MYRISDAPATKTAYIGVGGNFLEGAVQQSIRAQWKQIYVNRERFPLPGSTEQPPSEPRQHDLTSAFITGRIPANEIRYLDLVDADAAVPNAGSSSPDTAQSISSAPLFALHSTWATAPPAPLPHELPIVQPPAEMPPVQPPPAQPFPNQPLPAQTIPNQPPPTPPTPLPTAPLAPTTELELEFHERDFREHNGSTRWWSASGQEVISAPPPGIEVKLADLHHDFPPE
ncbi:hypothetical protein EIP86_010710 [Pleurotus ostreatoroseus]|nr:hypothetical protein EIP86_010710 [Pleurotus ostreatoroseus]